MPAGQSFVVISKLTKWPVKYWETFTVVIKIVDI